MSLINIDKSHCFTNC